MWLYNARDLQTKATRKLAVLLIVAALILLAATAVYLLTKQNSSNQLSPLRKDAAYRNGLYFVTSEIDNAEATAVLKNNVIYYDGHISGDVQITDNTEYEYSDDSSDKMFEIMKDKYSFTWNYGMTERNMIGNRSGLSCGEGAPVIYTKNINEYPTAGEEDTLVSLYITGFEDPLQFIVPAEGTAPEWGMIYGTFSPSGVVYVSPDLPISSKELLKAAKRTVFTLLPDTFSIDAPADAEVIGEVSHENTSGTNPNGTALGDTLEIAKKYGQNPQSETIDVSNYTSKYMYIGLNSYSEHEHSYYSVFLMDNETWIGKWDVSIEDDTSVLRCDYIFRVEPAATGVANATD